MPNRIIREGILTSERVNLLNWEAEVFYRRLMSVVDDFGRYSAHPSLLRAALYPLKLDAVRDANMERLLASVEQARLVRVYEVAGKRYLELLDFRQQTRAKESRFPQPPVECSAHATQVLCNSPAPAHVYGDVFGDGDEGGGECRASAPPPPAAQEEQPEQKKPKRQAKTSIPESFAVSDAVKRWAGEKGFGRLDEHLEAFVRKCKARSYAYVDWDSAFMEAIREDWAKLRAAGRPNGQAMSKDDRDAEAMRMLGFDFNDPRNVIEAA